MPDASLVDVAFTQTPTPPARTATREAALVHPPEPPPAPKRPPDVTDCYLITGELAAPMSERVRF
jgi:hypothetical protein